MLTFREATEDDLQLYFKWVNDQEVRRQSYDSERIELETHEKWFLDKVNHDSWIFLLFQNEA